MNIIINLILSTIAVIISAYVLPGVSVDGFLTAVVVAVILALVNTFIKPIIKILTFPISLLTLGLFSFVINALMVLLVTFIVPGFRVDGFLWALVFSIVLSLVSTAIHLFAPKD